MNPALIVSDLAKTFTMHLRGGIELPVMTGAAFLLQPGQCAVLGGPSGAGKSSILKMLYGNYAANAGQILVQHRGREIDLARAEPRTILELRRETIGYVSQFLRVVPRVSALDIVAEPLVERGIDRPQATRRAGDLLSRLNLPERLWSLPPATFSGGEQQRVNIARGFITDHPILLLDEPTASLDAVNRTVVVDMIAEKKVAGVALLGIFHDADVRGAVADTIIDVTGFAPRGKDV
ncbi:phosphonate C-P lyase system protein PhnL [Phyllobacterium salinisoli]|uniref:Phosphonate C-P lyase system protein PhnL n=1 Tax=Phyllobacterium salinisoli TaxID=1899321 RepID=A0A368K3G6_9HYPH|nr:phosphonate C-P lyase system protein PhnL [Phyllobacterium salinisoli]RCS22932.1 phosphonate C-P lyase system protein PhnL [Phyllobacterium salinisoli]